MASQFTPDPAESDAFEGAEMMEHPQHALPEDESYSARNDGLSEENYLPEDEAVSGSSGGGGFMSFLLCTTGFLSAGAGAAFATAPHFSWQVEKIGRQAAAYGLDNGVLFIGGLLLFGLGVVIRAVHKTRHVPTVKRNDGQTELSLVVEDLATDLAMFRQSILQVATQVEQFGAHQAAFQQEMRTVQAQLPSPENEGVPKESHDAMFRLAASLDQLNARLDERMHHMDVQLRSHFEGIGAAINENRESIDASMRALSTQMQARSVPTEVPAHSSAPPLMEVAGRDDEYMVGDEEPSAPPAEPVTPPPPGESHEFEVVVELEGEEEPEPNEDSLEFFETLEQLDEMVSGASPSAPSAGASDLDFGGLDLSELGLEGEAPAPAPEPPPVRPDSPAAEDDSLEALLPDENVRRALDSERTEEQ